MRPATTLVVTILASAAILPLGAAPQSRNEGVRAEVQIGICAPAAQIVQALKLRPRGAPLTVWQFDDSALSLFARGLRFRLRVAADDRSELTLKVANQDCAQLAPGLIPPREGKCEYDVYGTTSAGAVSLTRSLSVEAKKELLAGRVTLAQTLGPSQTRYLREVVDAWPLPPGIGGLGPMQVQTYRAKGMPYDVDISQLPGGEQYAEISRKLALTDADRTMQAMQRELSRAGLATCADQSSPALGKLRSLLR